MPRHLDRRRTPIDARRPIVVSLACLSFLSCDPQRRSEEEVLARAACGSCHAFPEPELLDRATWEQSVLPQMAPRLGVSTSPSLADELRNPHMEVLAEGVSEEEWQRIVAYYRERAPESLPGQTLPAEPRLDPGHFVPLPFAPTLESSAIITLLAFDAPSGRVFVGEAGSNALRILDRNGRLLSATTLGSPPTGVIVVPGGVLILESGILHPNDLPRGRLARYEPAGDSLRLVRVLIDSLFRPVFVAPFDFDGDGAADYVIAEYGNNRGRLALYRSSSSGYDRQVLDASPGAIRAEIHDLTGDGSPDIVALFGQGDERIVLFPNDGRGRFDRPPRVLARFPPVYGSMHFTMADFNGDRRLDIVYVNGDNFDYSRILKPYHGVRILERTGEDGYEERYFFPLYGAARAEVADFDQDGAPDIMATSNFADTVRHPERGIVFLEGAGGYAFRPHAFRVAAGNRWNVAVTADVNGDGRLDVLIGAMDLENIATLQRRGTGPIDDAATPPLLLFENRMRDDSAP